MSPLSKPIGLLPRILRYGAVGVSSSIAYSLLVILFANPRVGLAPVVASAIAFVLMIPLNYQLQKRITFGDRVGDLGAFRRFALTTASAFVVATAGMYLTTAVLNYSYYVGIALTWILIPVGNFLIYLFWVFRHPPSAADITGIAQDCP